MAKHTGFIFITPNGCYLTRGTYIGHGDYTWRMGITTSLDAAEIFPTDVLSINKNTDTHWSHVFSSLGVSCNEDAHIALTPIPATSYKRITIGIAANHAK